VVDPGHGVTPRHKPLAMVRAAHASRAASTDGEVRRKCREAKPAHARAKRGTVPSNLRIDQPSAPSSEGLKTSLPHTQNQAQRDQCKTLARAQVGTGLRFSATMPRRKRSRQPARKFIEVTQLCWARADESDRWEGHPTTSTPAVEPQEAGLSACPNMDRP
jgi:hypothetical protein